MGQYYKIVNLDKKQFIRPHAFGDGAKLMEFACGSPGVMTALAVLLADGNGRGGGDLRSVNPIIGSWAGDRIVVGGDYADRDKFGVAGLLYEVASEEFEDVSSKAAAAIKDDEYVAEHLHQEL